MDTGYGVETITEPVAGIKGWLRFGHGGVPSTGFYGEPTHDGLGRVGGRCAKVGVDLDGPSGVEGSGGLFKNHPLFTPIFRSLLFTQFLPASFAS